MFTTTSAQPPAVPLIGAGVVCAKLSIMSDSLPLLASEETLHQKERTPGPVKVVLMRDCWLGPTAVDAAASTLSLLVSYWPYHRKLLKSANV
ncbi:MAG: hypothetical protein ACRCXD_00030, partial [Luteolibacter sp.]